MRQGVAKVGYFVDNVNHRIGCKLETLLVDDSKELISSNLSWVVKLVAICKTKNPTWYFLVKKSQHYSSIRLLKPIEFHFNLNIIAFIQIVSLWNISDFVPSKKKLGSLAWHSQINRSNIEITLNDVKTNLFYFDAVIKMQLMSVPKKKQKRRMHFYARRCTALGSANLWCALCWLVYNYVIANRIRRRLNCWSFRKSNCKVQLGMHDSRASRIPFVWSSMLCNSLCNECLHNALKIRCLIGEWWMRNCGEFVTCDALCN